MGDVDCVKGGGKKYKGGLAPEEEGGTAKKRRQYEEKTRCETPEKQKNNPAGNQGVSVNDGRYKCRTLKDGGHGNQTGLYR